MTIKQQGGIFGRNPTFNDVTADGNLIVDTDVLFVDAASNRVGVKTTAPSATFEVEGVAVFGNGTNGVKLTYSNSADAGIFDTSYTSDKFEWRINNVRKLRLDDNGNLVMNSGSGIDFSATSGTGTSELFDDYEEGSFTVQFADAVSGGNSVNGGYGQYTKIGNLVTVSFAIVNMNTSGLTGGNTLYFRGLPYTARTVSGPGIFVGSVNTSNVTTTGQPTACLQENADWGYFRHPTGSILVSDVSSGTGDIYVSLTYEAV